MSWSPDPGTPLHGITEAAPINVSLVYTPVPMEENAVAAYSAEWLTTPIPSVVALNVIGASQIQVVGANVTGLAIISVSYLLDGVPGVVSQWDLLPPEAEDIYYYTISGSNIVTAQFRARATLVGGAIRDAVYTIQAVIDYSSGRDRLVAEIAARS